MPTVSLSLGSRSYDVIVENGALNGLGQHLQAANIKGKIALISDSNVAPLYAERAVASLESAGYGVSTHVFTAGEINKSLQTVEQISNEMVAAGHDRKSIVLALGGGVVGDLAGFIASIYYRGIPFVQVPTTVMAQVDSSVGGKTAVDIAAGKNLIGAFHQPRLVLVDPETLLSLPPRVLIEGMAEMVKHAAIRKPDMLPALSQMGAEVHTGFSPATLATLPQLLADNIAIKARVVEADEQETLGIRAFLNLGHTLGHGIEASVPYGDILHGEVVSLGMRAALWLSRKHAGLSEEAERELLDCLALIGLPLQLPAEVDIKLALAKTATDKKFEAGAIRFVLLKSLGEPELSSSITAADLSEAIQILTTPYQTSIS
ncbi:MAG: 3-dehydroquinate synthase [Akkermansia sp.]